MDSQSTTLSISVSNLTTNITRSLVVFLVYELGSANTRNAVDI